MANLLVVYITNGHGHFSKSINLTKYCAKKFTEQALIVLKPFNKANNEESQKGAWYNMKFN